MLLGDTGYLFRVITFHDVVKAEFSEFLDAFPDILVGGEVRNMRHLYRHLVGRQ